MSQLRVMILTAGLFLLAATVGLNGWAQAPGGGQATPGGGGQTTPGGGGPGGRGGGFGGPGGMRGFGGDSLLSLATRSAVQEDMKVSDKQKTHIKNLNEDYNQRRQQLRTAMRQNRGSDGGRRGGNQSDNGNVNNGGGNVNNGGRGANAFSGNAAGNPYTRGYDVNPFALNAPRQPNQQPQNSQQEERRARSQAMREGMTQLDQQANAMLTRILPGKQYQRLNQIQIQSQGLRALVRPDVAEKIRLSEDQVAAIQAVLNDRRTAQRAIFSKQGQIFRAFFRSQNPGTATGGNQAAGATKANPNGAPVAANGNNGGNRRRGTPPDFEAMRKFMERPEIKAQLDQSRAESEKLEAKATQAAYKILTKYQLASYKKLQGPPFDTSKLRPNFGGGPGGNRDANTTPAAKTANGATPAKPSTAPASTTTSAAPRKSTTAKSKAKSKTKSKRTYRRQNQYVEGDGGQGGFGFDFDQY